MLVIIKPKAYHKPFPWRVKIVKDRASLLLLEAVLLRLNLCLCY